MSSDYCEKSDIADVVGNTNLEAWADISNSEDAAEITARINRAIDVASDEIDDAMRTSPYLIPLVTAAGITPTVIVDIAAKLAGVWLYDPRGSEDWDRETGKPLHSLSPVKAEAEKKLEDIRTGKKRIDAL